MRFIRLYPSTAATIDNDRALAKLSPNAPKPADPLQGTWVFNDTIDFTAHGNVTLSNIPLEFVSNDVDYAKMHIIVSGMTRAIRYIPSSGGMGTIAYSKSTFRDVAYQTIDISTTFDELSTNYEKADLVLAFLQANATKQ